MTDKKIEEYLERALKIYKTVYTQKTECLISSIIEIAKMIQLEEYREKKYQGGGYDPLMYLTEKEKQDFFNKLSRE